eukprot:c16336_g1_i1 orf=910-1587(+)
MELGEASSLYDAHIAALNSIHTVQKEENIHSDQKESNIHMLHELGNEKDSRKGVFRGPIIPKLNLEQVNGEGYVDLPEEMEELSETASSGTAKAYIEEVEEHILEDNAEHGSITTESNSHDHEWADNYQNHCNEYDRDLNLESRPVIQNNLESRPVIQNHSAMDVLKTDTVFNYGHLSHLPQELPSPNNSDITLDVPRCGALKSNVICLETSDELQKDSSDSHAS